MISSPCIISNMLSEMDKEIFFPAFILVSFHSSL